MNTVDEWSQRFESLCGGYEHKNIFIFDETGLFFKVLPNKTLCLKTETFAFGKRSKERLTVALYVNMVSEFKKPLVIGKSNKPRCFKNVDTKKLPVSWCSNRKAWITRSIMTNWLFAFQKKMEKENRKIIPFLNNAASHLNLYLKNVKLLFFPLNTISYC